MNTTKLTLSLAALLAAGSASAQYTIKLGAAAIDPRATSSSLGGTLPAVAGGTYYGNVNTTDGIRLQVQKQTTLQLSIERALDDHFSAELALGYPPKHDVKLRAANPTITGSSPTLVGAVKAKVVADNGLVVASVRQSAPTVFLNYKFFEATSAFRPYVGVGVNYTRFQSSTNATGTALYNDGPVKIELTDSFGLAFQTGVNYKFNEKWSANLGWMTAAVKNHLTITTNHTKQEADYRFHPSVFSATVGYSF